MTLLREVLSKKVLIQHEHVADTALMHKDGTL